MIVREPSPYRCKDVTSVNRHYSLLCRLLPLVPLLRKSRGLCVFRKLKQLVKLKTEEFPHYERCTVDGRVTKLSQVSPGSKPRTYMGQSPILATVDLSPVQPQSSSQQDLSQDYRPASVSSRVLSFIQRLGMHFAMKDLGNRSQT